jgi:hypothetical protein
MPIHIFRFPRWLAAPILAAIGFANPSFAESSLDEVSSTLRLNADETRAALIAQETETEPAIEVRTYRPYGQPGQWWIGLGGGVAPGQTDGDYATDARLTLTTSMFIAEDFEFLMDWSLWGFFEDGYDTYGFSWSFLFRLHFPLDDERRTTLFLDGGVGLLIAADEVPEGGTNLNFLPQLGVGASHRLGDGPGRIVGGVRWHHISNARIDGEENNPSRDGVMFYLSYTFPI